MATRTGNLSRARKIKSKVNSEFGVLQRGDVSLVRVLQTPEEFELRRCDIWDVLRRSPKLGRKGAKRVLLRARVWPHDKLMDLTPQQREDILAELPARAR